MRIGKMGHRIIFATGNEGKMREIRALLGDLGLPVLSMKEAGVDLDIVEDGTTFGENAEIKAKAVWKVTGDIVLADDSAVRGPFTQAGGGISGGGHFPDPVRKCGRAGNAG